jgi:hypothetical protein
MTIIEGKIPEDEKLRIPSIRVILPRSAQVIRFDVEVLKIVDLHINILECENKGQNMEIKVKVKDKMLPRLSIYTVEETPIRAFVKRV